MDKAIHNIHTYKDYKFLPRIQLGLLTYWLIWPLGALVYALGRYHKPESKTIFWLFCVFFGLTFVIAKDTPGAADSARYSAKLAIFHKNKITFGSLINAMYNHVEGFVDIYQPLLTWLIAIFTDDPKWLFAAFGAVFGLFYAQNLWLLFKRINTKINFVLFLFILSYALVNPIWNINGVRMWTAAQVFTYGALLFFLENRKKNGTFWIIASPLFHFSFLFPVSLFLVFMLLPKRINLLIILYILSSFVKEIDLFAIRNFLSFLPEVFQPRVEGYTNIDYAIAISEAARKSAWHVNFASFANRIVVYTIVFYAFVTQSYWSAESKSTYSSMFAFALFLGSFANISSLVPSGGRFLTISNGLFYALMILLMGQPIIKKQYKTVQNAIIPLMIFVIIFNVRVGFDYMGFMVIFGNPLLAMSNIEQTPLIEFVKALF